MSAMLR